MRKSAGMPAGYPRRPIGLFGCKPPSGHYLVGAQGAEVGAQGMRRPGRYFVNQFVGAYCANVPEDDDPADSPPA